MFKIILGASGIVLVMIVLIGVREGFFNTDVQVIQEVEEVIEVEIPEWQTDEDAIKAAQDVIRKKELEAELEKVQSDINELSTRRDDIEKELDLY